MRIDSLTQEQQARFGEWAKRWIDVGLSTKPADFDAATTAALKGYQLANLGKPMVVLRMGSPYAATVGGAMAWLILKNLKLSKDQVVDQVQDQVWDQVRAQVWDQVRDQVRDQVWDQVGDQVGDQVRDQVRAQVWDQVRAQVWDQVRAQVGAQVWDQVRDQVRDQVWAQVWDQVRDQVGEIGRAARDGYNNYGYDAVWGTGFVAWVSFFRDVCGWQAPILEKFDVIETLVKSCGWTWWHQNVLAISDRPRILNRDDRGRLHSLTGPAISYPDGWAIHAVHGVRVPAWIIEQPEKITASLITDEKNAEVRRVMLEQFGVDRYINESSAIVVDQCSSDHSIVGLRTAKLYRKDLSDDEPIFMLDMLNSTPEPDGTTKRYMIRIDPNAYGGVSTCLAAMASTYRYPDGSLLFARPEDYSPAAES